MLPENSHLNICNFDYYLSAVESAFSDGFVKILIIGDDMQYSVFRIIFARKCLFVASYQ